MIKGFEKITKNITSEEEVYIAPLIMKWIKDYGPITSGDLLHELNVSDIPAQVRIHLMSGPRIRRIIHYLRCAKGQLIIATSKGYEYAKDTKQVEDYKESLKQRISSIQEIIDSL